MVEKSALVQVPDGAGLAAAARSGMVEHLDLRQVVDEPACLPRPTAQVGVLKVHKEALVYRPDLFDGPASYDHAGSGDPVDHRRAGELLRGGEETPQQRDLGEEPG